MKDTGKKIKKKRMTRTIEGRERSSTCTASSGRPNLAAIFWIFFEAAVNTDWPTWTSGLN